MKLGVIFPGYGSQFVGMGKEFYDSSRTMQENFDQASQCLDMNFVQLCFASSDAEISKLEKANMALFVTGLSIGSILKEEGISPSLVAGYDVGEYSALATIGGITLPDALYLLKKYSESFNTLLNETDVEALRVKGIALDDLQALTDQCANGNQVSYISVQELDDQFVVAGTVKSLDCVRKELEAQGITASSVSVSGGLHSPLMDPVLKNIKMYLEKVDFKDTSIPLVASITGQALTDGQATRAAVMQQIHAPIRWYQTMQAFEHCDVIAVIGECGTTKELCDTLYPEKQTVCITKPEDIDAVLKACGKEKKELDDSAE